MKLYLLSLAVLSIYWTSIVSASAANDRVKRQIGGYRFPGPRSDDDGSYAKSRVTRREPQYEESADQYTRSNAAPQYRQATSTGYSSQPAYRAESSQSQSYPSRASSYGRQNTQSYGTGPTQASKEDPNSNYSEEEAEKQAEEDKKPSKLELLLAQSKFSCSQKKDGYYADNSVACQVFHYCVSGAKHSWMCPEGTVFHQVHLNCVPASQDICSQSEKFFIVNDYLHKELESRGPNNTILYHQRYYPEEFLGESLHHAQPASQNFGGPLNAAAPQQAPRQKNYGGQPSYRPSSSNEDDGSYNPAPAAQQQPSYPRYSNNYAPSAAPKPAPYSAPPKQRKPVASQAYPSTYSSQSYPSNYPAPAAASSKPAATSASYAPSSSYGSSPYQQSAPQSQSYPTSSYNSQQYKPEASSAPSYAPAVNYAPSQPARQYKKVQASSILSPSAKPAPAAAYPSSSYPSSSSYGSYPSSVGSSYGSAPGRVSSSLIDSLKSGVTYEEDY